MNISFNKKNRKDDTIKAQIDQFKLKIDEKNRYLSNFDIFPDDNIFMFYVDSNEIGVTYKELKIIDIECYNDVQIDKDLKDLVDSKYTIYEQLMVFNDYFAELDEDESDEDDDKKEPTLPSHFFGNSKVLKKIFEDEDDVFDKISEETSDEEVEEVLKDVKPVKFDFTIIPKQVVLDLTDDIILSDKTDSQNYISTEIITNSKKVCKNAVVHLVVNEINKVIKTVKNIIIKPHDTVFELSVENKFTDNNSFSCNYQIHIPFNYPFIPPTITVLSVYNQSFTFALNNCEILNSSKWNPSTSLNDIVIGIYNNIEKLDKNDLKSNIIDKQFHDLTINLLKITNTEPLDSKKFNFNFDFLKINDKPVSKGIGYDFTGDKWDINGYLKSEDEKIKKITGLFTDINPLLAKNSDTISDTCLIPYIRQYIYDVSIMEVEKKKQYYEKLFEAFNEIYKLAKYNHHFNIDKVCEQREQFTDYPDIYKNIPILEKKVVSINKEDYVSVMRELAMGGCDMIKMNKFKFMEQTKQKFTDVIFTKRVGPELKNLPKNLPISETSSIFLRTDESNTSIMKFLIIPHPDTPYAYGCFEFDMYLPYNYPSSPPHVEIITTGGGTFRFNPNLYDNGKVCLSLLGTWSGSGGESWTPNSTILQVLLSIQSLIFCEEPYFNEPGYERDRGNARGIEANNKYNEPVRFNTMKLAMVEQLKNPSYGFAEVIKNHFRLKKNDIYKKLDEWEKISSSKVSFKKYYDELKGLVDKL
jgi:ubiquitin-protein ligase